MKKVFFALAVVLFCSIEPALPNDLLPGYVVTSDQDTLRGYIQYNIDADLAFSVIFVEDQNGGSSRNFSTYDLLGFGFNSGKTFERRSVPGASTDSSYVFAKKFRSGKIDMWIWRKKGLPVIFLENRESKRTAYLTGPEKNATYKEGSKKYSNDHLKYMSLIQYVKNDPLQKPSNKKVRYAEKSIGKHIQEYNARYQNAYPAQAFKDSLAVGIDATLGMCPLFVGSLTQIRAAVYAVITNTDKSSNLSWIPGASFIYRSRNKNAQPTEDGNFVYQSHWISLLPIGVRYQGRGDNVQPYLYAGAGIARIAMEYRDVENAVTTNTSREVHFMPALNIGGGIRIKAGSHQVLIEMNPSLAGGLYVNLGFGF